MASVLRFPSLSFFAAAVALAAIFGLSAPSLAAEDHLTAPEAYDKATSGELALFDIRSPTEWRQTGLPAGASAVTIHNPRGLDGFLDEIMAAVHGDKQRPIALICAAGGRSARAQRYLEQQGFTHVYDVSEGMLGRAPDPGWLRRGLPTRPCTAC